MQWIKRCLNSLKNSTLKVSTVVIDNGSIDGTQAYIQNHFPEVDFIQSKTNLGFGQANNIGIKKAYDNQADYVFLLNQDAWIDHNDTIENLVKTAVKKSQLWHYFSTSSKW